MEGFSEKTREYFPSLNRVNSSNQQIIYLDGPGGTQVPIQVIEAISKYYLRSNANTHGEFITSKETDSIMDDLRFKVSLMLGAENPNSISIGQNMTTLNYSLARALSRKFNIKIQARFCLLQKTMIMAEGIARQINPKANIWQTTEPLMEEWINDNMKYDFLFEKIKDKNFFSKDLFEIIQKIDKILKKFLSFNKL